MRIIYSLLALLASVLSLRAQEKVKEFVSSEYNRNGLSFIIVTRGDRLDQQTISFANKYVIDDKFDPNLINTKTIRINKERDIPITQTEADSLIKEAGIAKQIIGYIFNRKADGTMDDELIRFRGQYNADDQDVINAQASKVSEQQFEWGQKLVGSSYAVLLDFYSIHAPSKEDGDWFVDYEAFAYQIDCNKEKLEEFYEASWATEWDSAEKKNKAVKGFNEFSLGMLPVAHVKGSSNNLSSLMTGIGAAGKGLGKSLGDGFKGAGKSIKDSFKRGNTEENTEVALETKEEEPLFAEHSLEAAANDALLNAVTKLENEIPSWRVAVSIISTHPLMAKIGKKEGLSNRKRFRSYTYAEDREGNVISKKRGYLRATKVADNRGFATGNSLASEFYQISGTHNIKDGWTIKQKNDIKLGVMLTGRIGGYSTVSVNADFDYLIRISSIGSIYGLFTLGTDLLGYYQTVGDAKYSNMSLGIGAGYGIHVGRFVEIMPYATLGGDYMKLNNKLTFTHLSEEENDKTTAAFIEPGVRAAFQVKYPLSLFVKAGYDVLMSKDDDQTHYNYINNSIDPNYKHKSRPFGEIGIRYAF